MPHLDHNAFNSRRDERSRGHHTLRAYAQDLRTFARFTKPTISVSMSDAFISQGTILKYAGPQAHSKKTWINLRLC